MVFLTGQQDINQFVKMCSSAVEKVNCVPCYGGMALQDQMKVFEESSQRKVIVSSNIAESSLTIPTVTVVIDACLTKLSYFENASSRLLIVPVSKAASNQRAGRAGRCQAGVCYRLCTQNTWETLPESTPAEITRCDMTPVILQLKTLGVKNVLEFDYLS